ncbi:cytochrome P450-10 [Coleophoma cylindrospora]|uniref:Cytochrome P450-10 n=1 Tax=Coleophoma cylindrospora TaxID=1849047 RepID=A0A3D8RUW7_9HELO|nr:cytochrome P450-10 [Coleophoma cylindrospora]
MDIVEAPRTVLGAVGYFCTLSLGLAVLFCVGTAIYRLTLDPLAKFPGPKFNAISPIPGIRDLLRGRLAFENKLLHDKYGPVVRVSPNELHFNSVQAWEDIYGHRVGHPNFHKDPVHVGSVEPVVGVTTLTMADDENHARQRRALAHSFSQKALVDQEDIIQDYVSMFIRHLSRMSDDREAFNMVNWLNFTTFDIIGDLAFGEPFGCLESGQFHFWVSLIFEAVKAGAIEQATRRFATAGSAFQNFLLKCIPSTIRDNRRNHLKFSTEKVMRRLANKNTDHKDFIWYILKQREKFNLNQDEIIVNSALFIVAGSETTANALSGMLARLIYNPDVYAKLCAEIRGAFKEEKDIRYEALSALPYLNAVIEEGLRIHPPVPTGLLRTVPKEGDTVDGYWVPGGTAVSVGSWAASHNSENFVDPDSFIPERWLESNDPNSRYAHDKKKAAQPFSLGPRGCIGKHLSYLEMRIILGRLLWNFDLVSVDGAPNWNPANEMGRARAFMTWEKPDLNVKVVRVQR